MTLRLIRIISADGIEFTFSFIVESKPLDGLPAGITFESCDYAALEGRPV